MAEKKDPFGRTLFEEHIDERTYLDAAPGQSVCDFCMEPNPAWEYPCGPMPVLSPVIDASDDEWAACDKCYELIEAGDIEALVEYSVNAQFSRPITKEFIHVDKETAKVAQRKNVENFLKARTGPGRPFRP